MNSEFAWRRAHKASGWITALFGVGLLAGCGGLSDVGEQGSPPPKAVFTAVGYAGGDIQNGDIAIDVRGGSEVLLSGRASEFQTLPIVAYQIEPMNDAAQSAAFTVRGADAIAVVVPPATPAGEPLRYRLTVTDGGGTSSTAEATLRPVPALDTDDYLQYRGRAARFTLVAATDQPATAVGTFELRLKARVTYSALDRARKIAEFDLLTMEDSRRLTSCNAPAALSDDQLQVRAGAWNAGPDPRDTQGNVVASEAADDYRNPRFTFTVPGFNADLVTRLYQANLRDPDVDDLIGCLPDPGRVDEAEIELVASLASPSLQSSARLILAEERNGQPLLAPASNDGSGAPTVLTVDADTVEILRLVGGGIENKDTARAYYAAIDPQSRKTTLEDWLVLNCFDPDADDYGADAHAVYTNNFDLGFGRDMYMRTRDCDADGVSTAHTAAVVINYPTVEAAAKKVGAFLAVAMEYIEDTDPTQPGNATFYTYAPDPSAGDRQAGFVRVLSANFDGRGEKYVPGSCTTCHGGAPALPDLDDPLQTYAGTDANVGATFMPWDLQSFLFVDTREAPAIVPEPGLNDALRASLTRAQQEAEFRKLNLGAYHTYGHRSVNDLFTCFDNYAGPCELVQKWYGQDLSSPVFIEDSADNAPAGWSGSDADIALYNDVFARHCRACHVQRVNDTAVSGSDPRFSSASSFRQDPALTSTLFGEGSMPGARLTADRLWQSVGGAPSAGSQLAESIGEQPDRLPGQALACATGLDEVTANAVPRNQVLNLSSACSEFAAEATWTLLSVPTGSATQLAGASSNQAALVPDAAGSYRVALDVQAAGGSSADRAEFTLVVDNLLPQAAAPLDLTLVVGEPTTVDVLAQAVAAGDLPTQVSVVATSGAVSASVGADQVLVLSTAAPGTGEVRYALSDADGDVAEGLIRTTAVAEALVANAVFGDVVANSQGNLETGSNVFDLSDAVSGVTPQLALRFDVLATPSLPGPAGSSGSALLSASCAAATAADPCLIAYTPPPAVTSVFEGRRVGPDDSLVYRVCRIDAPTVCADGTVTIGITGQNGFAPVAAAMVASPGAAGCNASGCHAPTENPDPSWAIPTTASEKDAWCSLRAGDAGYKSGTNENGALLVAPGDFLASLMFTKPQVLVPHRGSVTAGDAALYAAIQAWVEEGAYYTGAAGRDTADGQACP